MESELVAGILAALVVATLACALGLVARVVCRVGERAAGALVRALRGRR